MISLYESGSSSFMSDTPKKDDEPKVTEEGQRKGDEILRRMLNTPPKPHKSKNERGAEAPRRPQKK
jgi:hypothetical protein